MKKILLLASLILTFTAGAQEFPKPSPLAKSFQVVGLTEVEIEYSSPAVNGREIFGDLVPLNKIWRTGANMATVITFSEVVAVGDKRIPAGSYAVFSVPSEDKIQFIFNTNTDQGGTGSYDAALDVAVIAVPFEKTKNNVERLSFTFENTTIDDTELRMSWANMTCVIPISVFTDQQAMENFKAKAKEYENGEYQLYASAASYFLEREDPKQALEMAKKSTDLQKKFWNVHTLALAYQANGDKTNALSSAQESLDMARKVGYEAYIKKNEKLIAELNKK